MFLIHYHVKKNPPFCFVCRHLGFCTDMERKKCKEQIVEWLALIPDLGQDLNLNGIRWQLHCLLPIAFILDLFIYIIWLPPKAFYLETPALNEDLYQRRNASLRKMDQASECDSESFVYLLLKSDKVQM